MVVINKLILKRILFFVFLIILLLFIFEVFLGVYSNRILEVGNSDNFDPVYGWTDYKNKVYSFKFGTIQINSLGFNDEEWNFEKGFNERRFIVLGDEQTSALQVNRDLRFSEKIESLLEINTPGLDFNVLNYGVDGFSTCNEYFVLVNNSLAYNPDTVFLFVNSNDFLEDVDSNPRRPRCYVNESMVMESYVKPVDSRKLHINIFFDRVFGSANLVVDSEENKQLVRDVGDTIIAMDKLLYSYNIPLVVVILSSKEEVTNSVGFPNNYLASYLNDNDVLYIDLYPYFKQDEWDRFYFKDGGLNEEGHEFVAKIVVGVITKKIV